MAGRPKAPTSIVDPADILTTKQMLDEQWTMVALGLQINETNRCVQWLAERKLIKNAVQCDNCNKPASLISRKRTKDGKEWRCSQCSFICSVRKGSFFHRSHLSLHQIIILIYCWANDLPQNIAAHEADTRASTVVEWFNFCRGECIQWLQRNPVEVGGFEEDGQPIVVEVSSKQHRQGHWIFGGIERRNGKCFLVEVPDHTTETLEETILNYILPGSHIMSDGGTSYSNLENLDGGIFMHSIVCDPYDVEVHVRNAENMWLRAQRKLIKQCGTSRTLFPTYLQEFTWRSAFHDQDIFEQFLVCIAENYVV